jgi:hypothetical protein
MREAWFGFFATIGTVPLLHALKDVTSPVMAFVLVVIALAILSFYTSISGLIKTEMFPPEVRAALLLMRDALTEIARRRGQSAPLRRDERAHDQRQMIVEPRIESIRIRIRMLERDAQRGERRVVPCAQRDDHGRQPSQREPASGFERRVERQSRHEFECWQRRGELRAARAVRNRHVGNAVVRHIAMQIIHLRRGKT